MSGSKWPPSYKVQGLNEIPLFREWGLQTVLGPTFCRNWLLYGLRIVVRANGKRLIADHHWLSNERQMKRALLPHHQSPPKSG